MEQQETEQIRKEAKQLLDKFSKALERVKNDEESNVIRDNDRRKEGEGTRNEANSEFRKIMFENAPQHDEEFIIAEKKTW